MARKGEELTCSECARFTDDALEIEAIFVGMTALSSAYGSTRGNAGICSVTDVFQNPVPACSEFLPKHGAEAR
jgi:hypothetical protein